MTATKTLLPLAAILLGGALCAQNIFYVDPVNGINTNNGRTPSTAYKTLTNAAASAVKGTVIMLLPGTYSQKSGESFPVVFGGSSTVSHENVMVIGAGGPSVTFLDGGGSYSGLGMLRARENAKNVRFTGITFKNMSSAFWSMGIRLGSASGDQFRALEAEVDNCVFDGLYRGIVLFGGGANTRQATGNKIHNCLFLNNKGTYPAMAMYGDGINHFYNNVIVNAGNDGLYLDSIVTTAPCKAVIKNNIIMGGKANGIHVAAAGGAVTVEFNNVFSNSANYKIVPSAFKVHASNMSMDPLFVDAAKGNYRLKANSPLIDAGTANVARLRHDPDYYPTLFQATNKGRLPDVGAYEYHTNDMKLTTPAKLGGAAVLQFSGKSGLAGVFVGLNQAATPLSIGVALIDTYALPLGVTSSNASVKIPVPNVAALEGLRVPVQGAYSGATFELLNVVELFVSK